MARPKEKQEEEKKETGKKYLPVQSSAGTKGQTAQERAKEILSMSREEQKARNQARLREALNRSAQSRPASSAQTEAMRRNFTKREQKEEYRRRYGTPQSSREAREQYQWNKRQREALEQYQSYFEKYAAKPTEEQVKSNPVLSDIGQLWKANAAQVQDTQKALEEIESTRVPSRAGRALFMAAQNANSIAPMEQARDKEQTQLSEEDQAFVDNARKRLEELYPQRDALEAKGDAEGLAEVNRLIDNEEKVMRDRGVALPGEAAVIAAAYDKNTKGDFDRYIKAVENAEEIDAMLEEAKERSPETYRTYLKAQNKVRRGLELTEEERSVYEGWSSMFGQKYEAEAEAKALEDGGVLESGFSYAERDRQRVNEGQLTQVEELSQYAGTMQAPIARQEASKLLTELYNQQYKLKKDIAAMELAGITGPAMDNAKEQLETVERQIAEGEYAMLRFEDDFAQNASANGVWNRNGNHDLYLINLSQEERDRLMLYAENNPEAGTNIAPRGERVLYMGNDAIRQRLLLTNQERATYNYLYNTQGEEQAKAYLGMLEPRLQKRRYDRDVEAWVNLAETPLARG